MNARIKKASGHGFTLISRFSSEKIAAISCVKPICWNVPQFRINARGCSEIRPLSEFFRSLGCLMLRVRILDGFSGSVVPCSGGPIWPYSWSRHDRVEPAFEAVHVETEFFMLLEVLVRDPTLPEIRALIFLSVCFYA
jgi:hypothetical protein